jgi:hypothetical protein
VVQSASGQLRTRHFDEPTLSLDTDDSPSGTGTLSEEVKGPERATTNVDGRPSRLERNLLQQANSLGPELLALE